MSKIIRAASARSLIAAGLLVSNSVVFAQPSNAEMWETLKKQQQQIEALQKQLQQTNVDVGETRQQIDATADAVESVTENAGERKTHVGGYGELHYNNGATDKIDFHRFVLFVNHEFTDRLRLYSELELEHALAGDGKPGEVELEQAFVEYDLTENHRAKAGLFLVPVGIINETHEPPTFYGVERNPVESNIIPATWWEAGAGVSGMFSPGWSYDVAIHSGLNTPTSGGSAFKPRNGRQKVANATAKAGAFTGRIKWTGIPGLEVAGALQYQSDVAQKALAESISATLFEGHAIYQRGPFTIKALYAQWDFDGAAPQALGRDDQLGWYIEPSYRFNLGAFESGVFARYNQYDNNAGNSADTEVDEWSVGGNFWVHQNVVLKADYVASETGTTETDTVNLGFGFQF